MLAVTTTLRRWSGQEGSIRSWRPKVRVGLVQLNASDDPSANLPITQAFIDEAAQAGASFVLTPEVTNCVSASRTRQNEVLQTEAEDQTLIALRQQAADRRIWLLIGSLALKVENDPRFVNRSFLVAPDATIAARYDKMHMFDVTLSETETYGESDG
jgi:predicted amidohydrolase